MHAGVEEDAASRHCRSEIGVCGHRPVEGGTKFDGNVFDVPEHVVFHYIEQHLIVWVEPCHQTHTKNTVVSRRRCDCEPCFACAGGKRFLAHDIYTQVQ